ncbi:MAG: tetratricopeptide repeat protein [Polyangiaceae bacterium]|nr:tetratricopeptide repeat protein [Polyangiaceae bacterium]MCW5790383.1 tetratricopeptide repeat protein [Polyangiaceae bacterium]
MNWVTLLMILVTAWAVVDATRRRVDAPWYFLIVLGFPIGALVYFVWVKLKGPAAGGSVALLQRADTIEQRGDYAQAELLYAHLLTQEPSAAGALHGSARCLAELGRLPEALDRFDRLMQVEPRFRDYQAALEYAETLHRAGRSEDAVDLLRGLVSEAPRPNHRLALAYYLVETGDTDGAQEVLEQVLASPGEPRWTARAEQMLGELEAER